MGKLMKYEFLKTKMSKLIILFVAAAAELLFLIGLFAKWDKGYLWGIILLAACAILGVFYIGIESILTLSKDLNTKQSYMLFMISKSSYQILGAKVLGSLITLAAAGLFFTLLAALDISLAGIYMDGLKEFLNTVEILLNSIFEDLPSIQDILGVMILSILQWFLTIIIGYLAVILSCTVLAGKRLSGLISALLFFLISWGVGVLLDHVPDLATLALSCLLGGVVIFALCAAFYLICCWIMERKLSV